MHTPYTVLSLQFTEIDYAIQEPRLALPIQIMIRAVRIDGTSIDVGNPVTIRVTPLTYSQFEERDIQLPPGFPTGPPTRPDDPAEGSTILPIVSQCNNQY